MFLNLGALVFADTATGEKTVNFGDYITSSWRSSDFKGTSSREWDTSGKTFTFDWNTEAPAIRSAGWA